MSSAILPEPPAELKRLSHALAERLRAEIAEQGFLPFARYMERVLYEPGLGYYSAGLHKFGAAGDFVTAPELGLLFARCLANQVAEIGRAVTAAHGRYDILELGAGSGRLAAGLLAALAPERLPARYRILERSADLRAEQRRVLAERAPGVLDRVEWLERPPQTPWHGVLIANEVVDALAVERFRLRGGCVEQAGVRVEADAFAWDYRPAPTRLERAVRALHLDVPEPYASEILPDLAAWLRTVTDTMVAGLALFVDYGYPRSEYYLPQRRDGTLMCHYRHRAHDDPFFWPGLQDLTAWVDFTALAEAGADCGLDLAGYTTQAMFLLGCGLDRILAAESDAGGSAPVELTTEARQLTLPGMMGERFQVMGLARGLDDLLDGPLSGFSLRDLGYRL